MSDGQQNQPKQNDQTPRARQRVLIPGRLAALLAVLLGCILVCGGTYYWLEMPRYVDLAVPAPGGEWSYVERTTQVWRDGGSKEFIVRKETWVYCREGYSSWASMAAYFDEWLTEHGWSEFGDDPTPCNTLLPETNFLNYGENGYRVYRKAHAPIFAPAPTACVAIWPIGPDSDDGFHVVLTVGNPSGRTELLFSIDHPGPVWRMGEKQ